MLKREWGLESNGNLPHILIPSKTATLVPEFAVENLPLEKIATLVPVFAVKDLPFGRTLQWWWWWMSHRGCVNDPDLFSYICGSYTEAKQRQKEISVFTKHAYFFLCFGIKLGDQYKPWAPNRVCWTRVEGERYWKSDKRTSIPFVIPMVWSVKVHFLHDHLGYFLKI